ncbi:MAG: hypothetical protein ACO1OQ_17055 [Rufibacter sp.]
MKKTSLLLCTLLALAACKKDTSTDQTDQTAQIEQAAGQVDAAAEAGPQAPDGAEPAAPTTVELPDEPMPGATSTASAAPSAANPLFNYDLRAGQAGAVKVGMPIAELKKQYGENKIQETTLSQEGMETKAFEILGERRRTDLVVEQQCTGTNCKVSRISVMNPAFKTPEGVGVGSTFGDIKKSVNITRVGNGEGNFVAISENAKMSFVLDLKDIPAEKRASLKLKDVPATAVVTKIYLF